MKSAGLTGCSTTNKCDKGTVSVNINTNRPLVI